MSCNAEDMSIDEAQPLAMPDCDYILVDGDINGDEDRGCNFPCADEVFGSDCPFFDGDINADEVFGSNYPFVSDNTNADKDFGSGSPLVGDDITAHEDLGSHHAQGNGGNTNVKDDGKDTFVLTPSMLFAYNAMRGANKGITICTPEDDLALLAEIHRQERNKAVGEPRLLGQVMAALNIEMTGGDDDRQPVFRFVRPALWCKPEQGPGSDATAVGEESLPSSFTAPAVNKEAEDLDASFSSLSVGAGSEPGEHGVRDASPPSFLFDDGEVSDEEGPREIGQISPGTFARWAEGCQHHGRESGDKPVFPADYPRMRPASPELAELKEAGTPRTPVRPYIERQFDEEDGEEMSPAYTVPACPSPLWEAAEILPSNAFFAQARHRAYDRMDPLSANHLRRMFAGGGSQAPAEEAEEAERFTDAEIRDALYDYDGLLFGNIPGKRAEEELAKLHAELAELERLKEQFKEANEDAKAQIKVLKEEREKAEEALTFILTERRDPSPSFTTPTAPSPNRATEGAKKEDESEGAETVIHHSVSDTDTEELDEETRLRNARNARIREYVAKCLRDVKSAIAERSTVLDQDEKENDELIAEATKLSNEISNICLVVGLSDFSEMIAEYERLVKAKSDPATKRAAEAMAKAAARPAKIYVYKDEPKPAPEGWEGWEEYL